MRTGRQPLSDRSPSITERLSSALLLTACIVLCGSGRLDAGSAGPSTPPAIASERSIAAVAEKNADAANGPEAGVPLFTFVFDDGDDTDYLVAKDIFTEQGAVACTAVTTGWINTPGYLTVDQIIGLRDAGWEIVAHTVTHPNLKTLTAEQVEDELSRSKTTLEGLGLTVRNLVYPYNKSNDTVKKIASKYYRSARGGKNEFNKGIIDRYELRSFSDKRDLARMKRTIDQAYRDKDWLIIYHHDIDAKITLTSKSGSFAPGEQLLFSPSGARGRHIRESWFLSSGSLHLVPLQGTPRAGDTVVGQSSNARALMHGVVYNERALIADMIGYLRKTYPDMRIVTIDQGLDVLGIPPGTPQ